MRHGSLTMATTGGCHDGCCRPVATGYKKIYRLRKLRGEVATTDAAPSLRKVQALQALGWTRQTIAGSMGTSPQSLSNSLGRDRIKTATAASIDRVYRILEMQIPVDNKASQASRATAKRHGWPPPLAYEDIETGELAKPSRAMAPGGTSAELVDYVMQYHDFSVPLSPAEKAEVVRRWKRSGRSERSLCQLTGWREGRYR